MVEKHRISARSITGQVRKAKERLERKYEA